MNRIKGGCGLRFRSMSERSSMTSLPFTAISSMALQAAPRLWVLSALPTMNFIRASQCLKLVQNCGGPGSRAILHLEQARTRSRLTPCLYLRRIYSLCRANRHKYCYTFIDSGVTAKPCRFRIRYYCQRLCFGK